MNAIKDKFVRALGQRAVWHLESGKLARSVWWEFKWIVIVAVADASRQVQLAELARRLDLIDLT